MTGTASASAFRVGSVALAMTLLGSCAKGGEAHSEMRPVAQGNFARVGESSLSESLLEYDGRRVRPTAVVEDALLSHEARTRWPHRTRAVERAILGRALLEELRHEQLVEHPPSDKDLLAYRRENWLMYDRPRAVRTIAISIPVPELADDQTYHRAATRLHEAAEGAGHVEQLAETLESIPVEVKVAPQRLPPLAADGRTVPLGAQDQQMEGIPEEFFEQASRLEAQGDVSPVFATEDAFVFLFATDIIDAYRPPLDRIRNELVRAVLAPAVERRARSIVASREATVQRSTKDLGALMELVWRRQ